jgi:peptidoglycan/LPS O-acetylase OafA/YrhL
LHGTEAHVSDFAIAANAHVARRASASAGAAVSGPGPSPRIPSLDGLRAVAIAFVLMAHASHSIPHAAWSDRIVFVLANGGLGVSIFFTISGYLITSLLLAEMQRTGTISLRAFFARRAFRILPAYFAYLACAGAMWAAGIVHLTAQGFAAASVFASDYLHLGPSEWLLGHTWSLSVEEQFYLFWPASLVVLGRRRAIVLALVLIGAAPILRLLQYLLLPDSRNMIAYALHTRMDALMYGCLAALLVGSATFQTLCRRAWQWHLHSIGAVCALVVLPRLRHSAGIGLALSFTLEGIVVMLCLVHLVQYPQSTIGRMLNARLPVFIGALSYSLYLWQQPFLTPAPLGWSGTMPWNLLCVGALAFVSYRCVELPFLRLRARGNRATRRAGTGA